MADLRITIITEICYFTDEMSVCISIEILLRSLTVYHKGLP